MIKCRSRASRCPTCGGEKDKRAIQCKRCQFVDNHPRETGGWYLSVHGYVNKRIGGKLVLKHRYIVEEYLGRRLAPHEAVHHIDGDKTNNCFWNLQLLTTGAHSKMHATPERMRLISALGHKKKREMKDANSQ